MKALPSTSIKSDRLWRRRKKSAETSTTAAPAAKLERTTKRRAKQQTVDIDRTSTLPDFVSLDPQNESSSGGVSKWSSQRNKKQRGGSSLPRVEASEVSLDTEKLVLEESASNEEPLEITQLHDNDQEHANLFNTVSLLQTSWHCLRHKTKTSFQNMQEAWDGSSVWNSALSAAVVAGILLPRLLILCTLLLGLTVGLGRITQKWCHYHWNDQDIRLVRRSIWSLYGRMTVELERTMQGDYARQVAAAMAFWACTAPGESTIGKILRWQMAGINARVIDELNETREKYLGYQ